MAFKPDIETMFHLKMIDLLYADAHPKTRIAIKQAAFEACGYMYVMVKPADLELIEDPTIAPTKGQYVRAFLDFGFKAEKVAEWFDLSPAGVSWHKTNVPKKNNYSNQALKGLRERDNTTYEKMNNTTN